MTDGYFDSRFLLSGYQLCIPNTRQWIWRKVVLCNRERTIQDIALTTPSSTENVNAMLDKIRDVIYGLTYWDKDIDLRLCSELFCFCLVIYIIQSRDNHFSLCKIWLVEPTPKCSMKFLHTADWWKALTFNSSFNLCMKFFSKIQRFKMVKYVRFI